MVSSMLDVTLAGQIDHRIGNDCGVGVRTPTPGIFSIDMAESGSGLLDLRRYEVSHVSVV